jgi:small-conductance mechanosensitive channel
MVERPIKIGDIVEVENVRGTVELVGARSTRIKTFDNLHLVVPNSTLLQNKLINWRLSDDVVRRTITVGVQYGSPIREVESLLKDAVNEHTLVEKYPEPIVLFDEFGDNALIFKLLIWVRLSIVGKTHLYIRQVESDIRFRIDELFREKDIVIAFPQRDVHLDTLKPLEIKLK